jgi:hypothetical protein
MAGQSLQQTRDASVAVFAIRRVLSSSGGS